MADLSAAPWPTVANFTSAGVYSWSALSAVATAARTAPRASPRRSALCGLRATNARSTATAAGVHLPMRRTHSAWRRANRTAAVARDPSAIVPLATWRSPRPRSSSRRREPLELLRRDVHVRGHRLDVVVVLERLEEPYHLLGRLARDRDR